MATQSAQPATRDKAEGKLKELEKQVRELRVADAELRSLRAGRAVLQKRAGVFFLSDKATARASVTDKIAELGQRRQSLRPPASAEGSERSA
mmetsp:Transcript_188/g.483  ORF Transcript_188/g.483 Transcript_188/m.483 type:complete len:92 (+) Transcript_188:139-414(+)